MNEPVVVRDVRYPKQAGSHEAPRDPQFGAVSPVVAWRVDVTRPRSQIIAEFSTQELRLRIHDRLVAFTAAGEGGEFPFGHPVIVASTSIKGFDEPEISVPSIEAVALAADRQWLDRMLVMRDSAAALSAAVRLGGRFAMRWDPRGVSVVDLQSGLEVSHFAVAGREVVDRCCPLIPDARPGEVCKPHGGPWVSMSITAAGHWNSRRWLYWNLVGCDQACPPPRSRNRVDVPTRYQTWFSDIDLAQPERHDDGHCRVCKRNDGRHRFGPGRARPAPGVITVTTPEGGRTFPLDEPVLATKGAIVEVGVDEDGIWEALGRLLLDPTGGPEDPLDWSDAPLHWQATDADVRRRCGGMPVLARWVAVGALRVIGVPTRNGAIPVAFDLRVPGTGLLLERTLIALPAVRIGEVGPLRLAISEDEPEIEVLAGSGPASDVAAAWIEREGLEALMALALEPYDPRGDEVLFDRRRHLALLAAVVGRPEFGPDAEELRRRLRDRNGYESARRALESPSSHPWLYEQLAVHVARGGGPFRPG